MQKSKSKTKSYQENSDLESTVKIVYFFSFILLLGFSSDLFSQSGSMYNQRDDQYRVLGLKRAKDSFENAKNEYDRQKQLFEKQLISKSELDRAKNNYGDAEVNYLQSMLAVMFEQQYVTVSKAIKYQDSSGKRHVRLTIENLSGGSEEFKKLVNLEDDVFKSLKMDAIIGVYVSLQNNDQAVISNPYETKINELIYGKPVTVDFILLQDVDAVTVSMIYGKGSQRNLKIFLQKDASANKVVLNSEQFAQEVELGQSTTYNFSLELFSGTDNTFRLEVLNLPQQINRYFVDPSTSARLSQIRFAENTRTKQAGLKLFLPDRPSDEIQMDKAIPFYVLVLPAGQDIKNLTTNKIWTKDEVEALNVGYLKLELVPRGIGKLIVRLPQLYYSVTSGKEIEVTLDVINDGTRALNNVKIDADPPLNWTKNIDPQIISKLDINEEKKQNLTFTPPADVTSGKYEIRLRSTSLSNNQQVTAEDKIITVEIIAERNVIGTIIIVILILGLVGGMIVFGIKLSKK